ncbi:MAG: HD domain-containing protein, partial [Clostridia bacterium]|nr:HD domain-containing protein [Clostridia bacterium]
MDAFGGIEDIKNKIIRCVGDPVKRFEEDALRILRGVRFASVLGFSVEKNTALAMKSCVHLLKNISRERQYAELKKLLCGKFAGKILREYHFVITAIIPELAPCVGYEQYTKFHAYDVYTHTSHTVDAIEPVPHLRLAALLHDCAKPDKFYLDETGTGHFKGHAPAGAEKAAQILKSLKADNFTVKRVSELIRLHDDYIPNDEQEITQW